MQVHFARIRFRFIKGLSIFFAAASLFLVSHASTVFAYTWQNVSGFLSANPAPTGCINWIEEVTTPSGSGYKIWQRCGGGSSYAGYFLSYWYNGSVYGCNGTKYLCNGTVHERFNYGDMDLWQRNRYCGPEGRIAEGYDCRLSDRLLTEFIPVEQCLDRLSNTYTSCARNCGNPVYSSYTYNNPSETCGDGIDNNCDGQVDEGCVQCVDSDSDGYFSYAAGSCPQGNDCDDSDPEVNPGAEENCDGIDNNCDGRTDEGCCEANIVLTPSEVRPRGTGGNNEADVSFTLTKPAPPAGCTLQLSVEPVPQSGGHNHESGRPSGALSDSMLLFSSGETGPKSVKYASCEVSGIENIKAMSEEIGSVTEKKISIKVPTLYPLGESDFFRLTGVTSGHSDNHYGTSSTVGRVTAAAQDYFEETGVAIGINDMSLIWGGLFDINSDWSTPHSKHRVGKSIDVDHYGADEKKLNRIMEEKYRCSRYEVSRIHYECP